MELGIKSVVDANTLMEFCKENGHRVDLCFEPAIGSYILEVTRLGPNYKPMKVLFDEKGKDLNKLIIDFAKMYDEKYTEFYTYLESLRDKH